MTRRSLARAAQALRDSGVAAPPLAIVRVAHVGTNRRVMISVLCGIIPVPFVARGIGFDNASVIAVLIAEAVAAVVLVLAFFFILGRVLRRDAAFDVIGASLLIVTIRGLHFFGRLGVRRRWVPKLALSPADVAFAQVEPRRSMFDPARFVMREFGSEELMCELPDKNLLAFAAAIASLREGRPEPSY